MREMFAWKLTAQREALTDSIKTDSGFDIAAPFAVGLAVYVQA